MKTGLFRFWAVGASIASLALTTACEKKITENEIPPPIAVAPTYVGPAESPGAPPPAAAVTETKVVQTAPVVVPTPSPAPVVQATAPASNAGLSAPLQELVKMQQSGVSEDVILSYVTNSPSTFSLGSDQIIYLHDLGISPTVTKAIIQHDSAAETLARQKAATPVVVTPSTATTTSLPAAYEETSPVTTTAPVVTTTTATPAQTPVSVNYFYNYLTPYGNWVQVDGYGLCWQPSVAISNPDWRPYSDEGYWLWSDNGWYWYSYYSWGWAPFHYGRWSHRSHLGWFWVPDTHWGPAWVSWRESGDYCGWAPLPPEVVFAPGIGLQYHGAGFAIGFDFGLTEFDYTFIPVGHFCERRPHRFFLPPPRRGPLFRDSIPVNRFALDPNRHIINHGVGFDRINHAAPGLVQRATFREAPLGAPAGPRPERLEVRAGGVVVHRPVLPQVPPPAPKVGPAAFAGPAPGRSGPASPPLATTPGGPRGIQPGPSAPAPSRPGLTATPTPTTAPGPSATPSGPSSVPSAGPAAPKSAPGAGPSRTPPGSPPRAQTPSAPAGSQNNLATMVTPPSRAPSPAVSTAPKPSGAATAYTPGAPVPSTPSSAARPAVQPDYSPRGTVTLPPISPQRAPTPSPSSSPPTTRSFTGPSPSVSSPSSSPKPSYSAPAYSAPSRPSGPSSTPSYSAPPSRPSSPPPSYSAPPSRPSSPPPSYSAPASRPSSPPPSYSAPPASRPSGPPPSSGGGGRSDDKKK